MNRKLLLVFALLFLVFLAIISYFYINRLSFSSNSEIPLILAENEGKYKTKPVSKIEMIIPYSTSLIYDNLRKRNKSKINENFALSPEYPLKQQSNNENNGFVTIEDVFDFLDLNEESSKKEENIPNREFEITESDDFIVKLINNNNFRHNFTTGHKNKSGSNYKLQLAVVKSEEEAKKEWERLIARFNTALKRDQLIIEMKVDEQGEVIFLVLAGNYKSWADAERICSKLLYYKQTCIIAN